MCPPTYGLNFSDDEAGLINPDLQQLVHNLVLPDSVYTFLDEILANDLQQRDVCQTPYNCSCNVSPCSPSILSGVDATAIVSSRENLTLSSRSPSPSTKTASSTATSPATVTSPSQSVEHQDDCQRWTETNNFQSSSISAKSKSFCHPPSESRSKINEGLAPKQLKRECFSEHGGDQSGDEEVKRKFFCKVCGDVASGFHYRVASCEACKAFFKRTVQGNINYSCPINGNCKISIRGRKACQACRFRKCIQVGMLKEGVRMNRARGGRQKYYRRSLTTSNYASALTPKVALEENKVLMVLKAGELEHSLLLAQLPSSGRFSSDEEGMSASQVWMVLGDLQNRQLIQEFRNLQQIPGMELFSTDEQLNIFRGSWADILTLSLIYHSFGSSLLANATLSFSSNFHLSEEQVFECGLEEYFYQCLRGMSKLSELGGIYLEEYLMLKAIIVSNVVVDDVANSTSTLARLQHFKETIVSVLGNCVAMLRPSENSLMQLQNLLLLLPTIREASLCIKRCWCKQRDNVQEGNALLLDML